MKPYAFSYVRPQSIADACALLAEHGDMAAVLAGGQSLVPLLNLRLTSPALVVDINRLAGLQDIAVRDTHLEIGALCRHDTVLRSPLVNQHAPILAAALRHVAHPAIRNRGTFGGSVALADPAAELPACCVALEAEIVLASATGTRTVAATEFFLGVFATARRSDELVVAIRFPLDGAGDRFVFDEIARRHGDYAIVGLAAVAPADRTSGTAARFVFFGLGDAPRLASQVGALATAAPDGAIACGDLDGALDADLADMDFSSADMAFKRTLAGTLAWRAMRRLPQSDGAAGSKP